ncbi:potassium-transporting ATPase subunit KdpC [Cytobacillus firmus]|uniref:potassium-transporting ATPase subunit KdpC n=1 Tax=Cytobacillus firmus TaxID=1399 RepID=UPI001CFE0D51|nr:potassium-transporting ATPase subunit KdpC [Cytobacillus firmus]
MQGLKCIAGPIVRTTFVIMLAGGLLYPLAVTGIAQVIMPDKADGSLIYSENNEVIGSALIGQSFSSPEYFHGRVSSIEYDGAGSGSNNYAPSNQEMIDRTKDSIAAWKTANQSTPINEVPIDLLTNSGSGLDPHISPEAAFAQVGRISELTGIDQQVLRDLVDKHTEGKELGLFGEERVNVLKLNLDLEELL